MSSSSSESYSSPILVLHDIYSYKRNLLNTWNGSISINTNEHTILAASFIAGRKERGNAFTGVLLGEVGQDID
jgi:hypothetical protein